jgi:polyhydroxybutyrate depolymerase
MIGRVGLLLLLLMMSLRSVADAATTETVTAAGLTRTYLLQVPPATCPGPWGVVYFWHGGDNTNWSKWLDRSGFGPLADRDCWMLAFPRALDASGPSPDFWHSGIAAGALGDEDLLLFDAILAREAGRHPLDVTRVVAVGHSNGGMMTHRLACERAGALRGMVSTGSSRPVLIDPTCAPDAALHVLVINGTSDGKSPYSCLTVGGCTVTQGGKVVGAVQTAASWATSQGCTATTTDTTWPAVSGAPTIRQHDHAACQAGSVRLIEMVDVGHVRPTYPTGSVNPAWIWAQLTGWAATAPAPPPPPPPPPTDPPPSAGTSVRGLYVHARRYDGKLGGTAAELAAWQADPLVAGTQASYSWRELEPADGVYAWDRIETEAATWARAGKRIWIEIVGGDLTPDWVYAAGVPAIQAPGTARYPVYWHPTYRALWARCVAALAARFDGDARLAWISPIGYAARAEPSLARHDEPTLLPLFEAAGFAGYPHYTETVIQPMLALQALLIRRSPRAVTIRVSQPWHETMAARAAALGYGLTSNGFGVNAADAQTRAAWRDRLARWGAPWIGYSEVGPAGYGSLTTAALYQGVLGDEATPGLAPAAGFSVLPFRSVKASTETVAQWRRGLEWAASRVR